MPQAPKSFQQVLQELWDLVKAYAMQETVGPLKDLGRQIGLGLAGALAFALGYFLIVLGIMRWLQFHGPAFLESSNWNFLTYLLGCVLLGGAIFVAVRKVRGKNAAIGPDAKKSGTTSIDSSATPVGASTDLNPQEPGR